MLEPVLFVIVTLVVCATIVEFKAIQEESPVAGLFWSVLLVTSIVLSLSFGIWSCSRDEILRQGKAAAGRSVTHE